MNQFFDKVIKTTFYLLFFLIPLVFYPYTSEIFEFNKITTIYAGVVVIATSWIAKMILEKKFILRRTILDIPLLIFISSQLISTITSIDFHTSVFGYYSRFNGGFLSILCYAILYWAFVSNIDKNSVKNILSGLVISSVIVSTFAFFEHYGHSLSCLLITGKFNVSCWIQDVQNRVFATLGQPNWLATFLVSVIPINWYLGYKNNWRKIFPYLISSFFLIILLFTKSRSGLLGYIVTFGVFWGYLFLKNKTKMILSFSVIFIIFLISVFIIGTPWTNTFKNLVTKNTEINTKSVGPALETGGTESGEIRKIVWKGAVNIWKNYPIFGSGVETFAFSYFEFRPVEHNQVSEWDYIYNKAHNEYLNFAATTGSFGLISYLILIGTTIALFVKNLFSKTQNEKILTLALFSGYLGILITNFFGFSVTIISLFIFVFPAISISFEGDSIKTKVNILSSKEKIYIFLVLIIGSYFLYSISNYWYADILYAKAQNLNRNGRYVDASLQISKAILKNKSEALYYNELATSAAFIANAYQESNNNEEAQKYSKIFEQNIQKSMSLSPKNLNIKRNAASLYTKLSALNSNYLIKANSILITSEKYSPTDPRVKLNLAGTFIRLGNLESAEKILKEVVVLKPDYKEGRYALAALLSNNGNKTEALKNIDYILKNVDPNDKNFKSLREDIQKE